jgi:hypothetical protein
VTSSLRSAAPESSPRLAVRLSCGRHPNMRLDLIGLSPANRLRNRSAGSRYDTLLNPWVECFSEYNLGVTIVPEISRFLGIVIAMYFKDHGPSHFHAKYGSQRASFSIHDLRLLEGKLPPRVVSFVLEWALELLENWMRAEPREDLHKIEPLV